MKIFHVKITSMIVNRELATSYLWRIFYAVFKNKIFLTLFLIIEWKFFRSLCACVWWTWAFTAFSHKHMILCDRRRRWSIPDHWLCPHFHPNNKHFNHVTRSKWNNLIMMSLFLYMWKSSFWLFMWYFLRRVRDFFLRDI